MSEKLKNQFFLEFQEKFLFSIKIDNLRKMRSKSSIIVQFDWKMIADHILIYRTDK